MGLLRVLICLLFPPLAVLDKGCGVLLLVCVLTLFGWIPGVLAALIICVQQPPTPRQQARESSLGVVAAIVFVAVVIIGLVAANTSQDKPSLSSSSTPAPDASIVTPAVAAPARSPAAGSATPPSQFQTAAEAQQEAARRYPELAVAGSAFNKAFLAEVAQRKQTNPEFFASSDWPIRLASELAPKPQARYDIAKRWSIPNSGEGKTIVIPRALANEAGMAILADKLREDTRSDRNAFVCIFDDRKAAEMRDRLNSLTPAERAFYQRHFMGTYLRNINTGHHEMEMHPAGMNGPSRTLKF